MSRLETANQLYVYIIASLGRIHQLYVQRNYATYTEHQKTLGTSQMKSGQVSILVIS